MARLILLVPLILAACGGGETRTPKPGEQLRVIASTPALASLALAIAGADAQVELFGPQDGSTHDFEPSVSDRRRLESAHLLLINGMGLEHYEPERVARAARVKLVDCSAVIPRDWLLKAEQDDGHGHDHNHGEYNPHVWLATEGAIYLARAITAALAAADSANAKAYNERFDALKKRLEALRAEYQPRIEKLARRNFASNHDAFPYFAREFGLKQVGVIQRTPGHNPTVEQRRAIEKMLAEGKAHAIFVEPGYDDTAGKVIAANSRLPLAVLDPFDRGKPSPDGLEMLLRSNLETVLKTLGD
ncbi:MAG: zinc ABC transporter substrate-binding protein [Planctomycetes bacterium]|nr:zinc ABC transporter substrate-binding protein [Planctomycetota bacterium]MCW8135528.1 zinc ABC transporter substrate-binding protein [Planctomycetota bacterium]